MFKSARTPIAALLLVLGAVGPALVRAEQPMNENASRRVAMSASTSAPVKPRDFMISDPLPTRTYANQKTIVVDKATGATATKPVRSAGTASTLGTSSIATVSNSIVCNAVFDQSQPTAIQDGGGGYFIAWSDYRYGTQDIFAMRVNGAGTPLWAPNGVNVYKGAGFQSKPLVVSDGLGGAIVVWQDSRNGNLDIYAQRVSSLGAPQWDVNGVPICTAVGDQRIAAITSDGADGAIVTWEDDRGGATNTDIYTQRISDLGVVKWTANGVALCTAAGIQQAPTITTDELSGAIVTWQDFRGGATSDIYAQRVNATGAVQWAANGVVLCGQAGTTQELPVIVADAAGGAIVAWSDARTPANGLDVYAQRVNASGVVQWAVDGVALVQMNGDQKKVKVVPDGAGGVVAAWHDFRAGTTCDVYARRVNNAGAPQWTANGVQVCNAPNDQFDITLTSDNLAGAFVAWSDGRTPANGNDIYVQHLDGSGNATWTGNGVVLCDTTNSQDQPAVVADGTGGAFVCWRDFRSGTNNDIYSQRVNGSGQLPDQCAAPTALANALAITASAPTNNYTFDMEEFYWTAVGVRGAPGSDWDMEVYMPGSYGGQPYPICHANPLVGSYQTGVADFVVGDFNGSYTPQDIYDARAVRFSGSGSATVEWDDGGIDTGTNPDYLSVNDSKYTTRTTGATDVLEIWDVLLASNTTYTFQFQRNPTAGGTADVKLLLFSAVNRPLGNLLMPRSARVLELQRDGLFTTPVQPGNAPMWYGVVVVNDNGQSGDYKLRVLSGAQTTDVGDRTPGLTTGIKAMAPNPSKGGVRVDFVMHEAGEVSFQIYDMQGRLASTIPSKSWQPGSWNVAWNGRGQDGQQLPAGLYFVQMKSDNRVVGMERLTLLH